MSPVAAGLYEAHMEERIAHITEACSFCGKCYDVCPMVAYADFPAEIPEKVVRSVIDILNGRPYAPEGAAWARACQKSGLCIEACPEDVNPREMLAYAKIKLLQEAESAEALARRGREEFRLLSHTLRLVGGLQTDPDLFRRLTAVHGKPKERAESVFYFGCNILQTPHILLSCMDVFDRMGIDYEVAGGVAHCCGIKQIRAGDVETGAGVGTKSLEHFRSFSPERVITFCPTCHMQYTEFGRLYSGAGNGSLPFVHITRFLVENRSRLEPLFVRPVEKRVAIHRHGGLPQVEADVGVLLRAVPGLEVAEIEQLEGLGYQCPGLSHPGAKEAMRKKLFASAREAGVDTVATIYHSCHRELCGAERHHPFEVENFATLLGQAMGFDYPDRLKTFKLYRDMDRVLAEAGERLRAHGLDPADVRGRLEKALYG